MKPNVRVAKPVVGKRERAQTARNGVITSDHPIKRINANIGRGRRHAAFVNEAGGTENNGARFSESEVRLTVSLDD